MKKPFPHYRQPDSKDCGPTCIRIIAKHYGKLYALQHLRTLKETVRDGSSLLGLSDAAETIGLRTLAVKIDAETLLETPLPCILHWNKKHFVVLYDVKKTKKGTTYYVSDPAYGLLEYAEKEFLKHWIGNNATHKTDEGIGLLFETTPKFYDHETTAKDEKLGFAFISKYLFKYKKFITQLIIGLIAGSVLQLIFPFLTQSIVDVGIKNQDVHFVYLIFLSYTLSICLIFF